ncbi:hypothetical protein [Bacillus sp. AK128]
MSNLHNGYPIGTCLVCNQGVIQYRNIVEEGSVIDVWAECTFLLCQQQYEVEKSVVKIPTNPISLLIRKVEPDELGEPSHEIQKLISNMNDLDISRLRNHEIVCLYFLKQISYRQYKEALNITGGEGDNQLKEISRFFRDRFSRIDEDLQHNAFE